MEGTTPWPPASAGCQLLKQVLYPEPGHGAGPADSPEAAVRGVPLPASSSTSNYTAQTLTATFPVKAVGLKAADWGDKLSPDALKDA